MGNEWAHIPMLARTHGQAATPTRVGKEILVWVERLNNQVIHLNQVPFNAKFGGATGQFNAHYVSPITSSRGGGNSSNNALVIFNCLLIISIFIGSLSQT